MKGHHIKIQKQKMDTRSVLAHRNFNKVMQRYKRSNSMYRVSNLIAISGTLLIIIATVYFLIKVSPNLKSENSAEGMTIDSVPEESLVTTEVLPPVPMQKAKVETFPAEASDTSDIINKPQRAVTVIEKKGKGKSDAVSSKGSPEMNKEQSLKNYLHSFVEAPQHFNINPAKDTMIEGSDGTQVIIPANSFTYKDGRPVQNNIVIALQEFYTIPDMVFAGLSTTSNGMPLETGGMIHIGALAEDEPLELEKNRNITLKFPYTDHKKDMQLFTSKETETGRVNWLLTEMEAVQEEEIFQVVEHQPEPVGGMKVFYEYIRKNLKYPHEARRRGIQGRVFVQFVVDTDGSITDVSLLKGIGKECDEEALRLIENSPKWIPGRQRGKPVKVRMSLPVVFKLDGVYEGKNQNLLTPPASSGDNNLPIRGNTKVNGARNDYYYTLKSNKLGWINCDRFLNFNGQKTSLVIPAKEAQTSVVLIFKNYKSVLPPNRRIEGRFIFDGIPATEEVVVLALKLINNTPFVAFKELKQIQTPGEELVLQFEQTGKKEFAGKVKSLLR